MARKNQTAPDGKPKNVREALRSKKGAVVTVYIVLRLAVILVLVVILSRVLDGTGGVLKLAGKPRRVMPKGASYVMFYVTCAITAAVVIASIFLGAHLALYGVMVAWLLVSAVYYTVKLM